MATDFWASSHFKRWIVDRATLRQARSEDSRYVDDPNHIAMLGVFFANLISKLGNKLQMRQRVIATATIFFRRFYLKNSYCETDPYLVLAACCYVAAKAEESPVHIKTVIAEARSVLSGPEYNVRHFPTENSKLAEMEFYLVDELECDLVVFHPYRTLMTLVKDASQVEQLMEEKEAGELGAGIEDGPRYWGTGQGRLDLPIRAIQDAWFLINDTYRSDICLLYPPHLIAIAALYLVCVQNPLLRQARSDWVAMKHTASAASQNQAGATTRRSARQANSSGSTTSLIPQKRTASSDNHANDTTDRKPNIPPQDFVGFFASLNVNMRIITTIAQEMISLYAICDRVNDDYNSIPPSRQTTSTSGNRHTRNPGGLRSVDDPTKSPVGYEVDSRFLVNLLNKMRAMKEGALAHPASSRGTAVNKLIERTQGAG
ncbi:SSN8 [Sanghuangporus weigelae]